MSATFGHGSIESAGTEPVPGQLAVRLLETMLFARALDERIAPAGPGAVPPETGTASPLGPPSVLRPRAGARGWEAAVVGAAAGMHDDDFLVPSAATLAAALWRGVPVGDVARRRMGVFRADDPRGAPSTFRPARVFDTSSLPGRHIPHAVGLAWAARLRKAPIATLALFDVGATTGGDFHAGLNIAGVVRAPLISVCVTPAAALASQTASGGVSIKALAYGLRGVRVDGTDAIAVMNAVREARAQVLAGDAGTLVEAVLAASEPTDPIARLRAALEARSVWSGHREAELSAQAAHQVERAIADAVSDRPPMPRDALFDHVYAELPWHLEEQKRSLSPR